MTRRELLLLAAQSALAQEFDVATIRPNRSASGYSTSHGSHGRFRATNMPLKSYIRMAYDLMEFQITGPAWIDSDRYDINAEGPDGPATFRPMLQALLRDRFQLRFHRENRVMPVYELRLAAAGLKAKSSAGAGDSNIDARHGQLTAHQTTMKGFAEALARQTNYPVIDRTDLTGPYDFSLAWLPDQDRGGDSDAPSLLTAIQEQLGLKLQPAKAPVEIFVVDSAIRTPVDN